MQHVWKAAMLAVVLCAPALAEAPVSSPLPLPRPATAPGETTLVAKAAALQPVVRLSTMRPLARPALAPAETTLAAQAATLQPAVPLSTLRPQPRPATASAQPPLAALAAIVVPAAPRVRQSGTDAQPSFAALPRSAPVSTPRPEPRPRLSAAPQAETGPESIQTVAAVRILPGKSAITSRKGSVCGDPSIKGEVLAPITSRVKGCGIDNPVRVTSVDGVALNQSAVISCETAVALKDWVSGALKPAFGRKEVVALRVAASYSCRPRNNVKGAKISEHGRGKAIDISAIQLANGDTVSVAEDWRRSAGKPMKKAYKKACGTFGTTLGPDADRHHRDHMHFDVARQRGGAYCR